MTTGHGPACGQCGAVVEERDRMLRWKAECCESPWAEESYDEHGGRRRLDIVHLVLANPRPLDVPIPCKGRLGLWTPPGEVLEQLQVVAR